MPPKRLRSKRNAPVTIDQANLKIATLSKELAPTFSGPENLDRPLDKGIQVTPGGRSWRVSLVVDGVDASHARVIEYQQQVGTQTVRMGGIAGVGTHDSHRFKGYSRVVMLNCLRFMRQEGFDVTMLFGISGFYPKFGYAEAFPAVTNTMTIRDAERVPHHGYKVVDFQGEYLRPVLAMYRKTNAGRTGVIHRDGATWTPFRKGVNWGPKALGKVVLDGAGRPVAYFACDIRQEGTIVEAGYTAPRFFGDLVAGAAEVAWKARMEKVAFHLPQDDPFVEFCKPYGLRQEILYRRDAGAMVRMINIRTTLEKLAPMLAARMSGPGKLTLRTNLEDVGLSWEGGKLRVGRPFKGGQRVQMPQWALAQMIYGYYQAGSPQLAGAVKGSAKAVAMLDEMFPTAPHHYWLCDEF